MKEQTAMKQQIEQARGLEPADLVLKKCTIIDVFCGDTKQADIAICGKKIAGIGEYSGREEIDCNGLYVAPGFMEGHIHIESSMLSPNQFAQTVIGHGTTTVICDPHEIANVAGSKGINYFTEESKGLDTNIYCMAPSCVPATHLENSGANLDSLIIEKLLEQEQILGLAEMMNFPGVLFQDKEVMAKLAIARKKGVPIDGHAPGLTGKDLQAYIGSGIGSDHECVTAAEATEKVRSGMYVFIREGSAAKNLESLLPAVTAKNSDRFLLVTDDCHPHELVTEGHLDRILRKAISLGLDPITAIQMVTINVANYYGLRNVGAVAPGYDANLVIFNSLQDIQIQTVLAAGKVVQPNAIKGKSSADALRKTYSEVFHSVNVDMENLTFSMPAKTERARVIKIVKDELITEKMELSIKVKNGFALADPDRDIAKLAVVERHHGTGNVGRGFVQGIGLQRGALASTIGHDSHNITVIGVNDNDMMLAVQTIVNQQGGIAVVADGVVEASLTLDVAGLMSSKDAVYVADAFADLLKAAKILGVQVEDPFMFMSFLALPVIPHLKITDLGLVDVDTFSLVELWV
jgi:adenine deaminase